MYSEKQQDIDNIKSLFPYDVEISQPTCMGKVHSVYIVKSKNHKIVLRFSDRQTALQNAFKSQVLRKYEIPVPNIGVYKIGSKYCEEYTFIEGQTLYERSKQNLSQDSIAKIYNQLYDICYKMSKIPTTEFSGLYFPVTKSDILFQTMNLAPRVIGHSDLHDKNILIDKDDNVCGLVDLDSVLMRPFALFLIKLFEQAKNYGYDIESIKTFNPDVYNNGNLLDLRQQVEIYHRLKHFFDMCR